MLTDRDTEVDAITNESISAFASVCSTFVDTSRISVTIMLPSEALVSICKGQNIIVTLPLFYFMVVGGRQTTRQKLKYVLQIWSQFIFKTKIKMQYNELTFARFDLFLGRVKS